MLEDTSSCSAEINLFYDVLSQGCDLFLSGNFMRIVINEYAEIFCVRTRKL